MIKKLPLWVYTGTRPAVYDSESVTAIEMVAKLYGSMQEMIDDYNAFVTAINKHIEDYENDMNASFDEFKDCIVKTMNEYIETIDTKINLQDDKIQDAVDYMKENLVQTVSDIFDEALENGDLTPVISTFFSDLSNQIAVLSARMDTFASLTEGSTTGDAELLDIRIGHDGATYSSAGNAVRGQVEDLNEIILYTREPGEINLFNPTTLLKNTGIDSTTGELITSVIYDTSDFIAVDGTYIVKPFEWSGDESRIWIYRYDANKTFTVRNVVTPASYPDGYGITHTGYIRIQLDRGGIVNGYENPWKYAVIKSTDWTGKFIPYYTEIDTVARTKLNDAFIHIHDGVTDADDITEVGYYYLSTNNTINLPETIGAWYLWMVKLDNNNMMQIAYEAYVRRSYIRAKVLGSWGDWKNLVKESADDSLVTSTISLFPTVGCCGDSFTAGYLYNKTDSQWYDPNYVPNGEYPQIGFPAVMGRLYGIDVTSFAKGGLTSTAYRTDAKGLPAILADSAKDLYIIALGLNDKTQNIPLGVEADIDTEPATATYLGNMGAIIRSIQNHAPLAKIILCKSLWMNSTYYNYISDGVELLSSHLGIPYIETKGDPYFESDYYINGLKGLHPTAPLYAGIGKRIGELVGKIVIENPDYFYNFYVPNSND